jgi:hypothetical protein
MSIPSDSSSMVDTPAHVTPNPPIDLGNMFICSHQGRMQYLMGRELLNENNELIIFSDLKINLGELVHANLNSGEVEGADSSEKIKHLFDKLPNKIQKTAEKVSNKSLYDYFMCSSYIKFKNCAILRLKFEPITDSNDTRLTIELIHEGSLEKDEEIVTNTKGKVVYWVKGQQREKDGLRETCEFPTLELILGDGAKSNIQADIFVMRHGYGEHNRAKMDGSKGMSSDLTDAALTPAGVKQCVEAAKAFELERKLREEEGKHRQPLIPSDFKYRCSDLRRTWQSLSAFNLQRDINKDITMLPYMHEFEYKSIIPYGADDVFLTKGYLAAGGKFLGRASYLAAAVGIGSYLGATPLVAAGAKAVVSKALASKAAVATTSAGKALATKAAALQVPKVAAGTIAAGTGIVGVTLDQLGTDGKIKKGIRGLFMGKGQGGGMKEGMKEGIARVALGEAGKRQFIRMLATENRSKLRGDGVFVGTGFTAEIPRLDTVTVNTDFYRTMKIDDPVLQEYRYTFFGILIACNNHTITLTKELSKKDLKPKDKRRFASLRRSYNSKDSGQEKVTKARAMGQEGGYKKTRNKTRKKTNKKTSKKTRKKTKGTKMRKKKTHKRTKKNKKNKRNP